MDLHITWIITNYLKKIILLKKLIFFLFKILAALDLCCGTQNFSSCRAWALECVGSAVVLRGILVPQ